MADERHFEIASYIRQDGVFCYFFKIDGHTRFSSYDATDIRNFAKGYCGREIEIQEPANVVNKQEPADADGN